MKLWRLFESFFCVVFFASSVVAQEVEAVRPTGVTKAPRAQRVTTDDDEDEPPRKAIRVTPAPKAKAKVRRTPREPEESEPPKGPGGIPNTRAKAVMMID